MKVKFIRDISDGSHILHRNHEAKVSDERGRIYIENGWAEEVRPPKDEGDVPKTKRAQK